MRVGVERIFKMFKRIMEMRIDVGEVREVPGGNWCFLGGVEGRGRLKGPRATRPKLDLTGEELEKTRDSVCTVVYSTVYRTWDS